MLRWRLLLGTIFVIGLAALAWLEMRTTLPVPPLFILALVLSLAASSEVIWLLEAQNLRPLRGLIYVGNFAIVASNGVPLFWPNYPADCPLGNLGWPLSTFMVLVLICFLGEMRRYEKPGGIIIQLALAVFALAYVGLLLSYLVQLRMVVDRDWGLVALVSLIVVVKMGDTGAYTTGRLFGRHKMAPVLSPGKTLEGAIGGAAFAILGSWAVFTLLAPKMVGRHAIEMPWWTWAAYGLLVGLTGMFGDLAESLFKRDMGRKDSSSWMPGFGGTLDLLDSILFAAPVAYLCWISGVFRP